MKFALPLALAGALALSGCNGTAPTSGTVATLSAAAAQIALAAIPSSYLAGVEAKVEASCAVAPTAETLAALYSSGATMQNIDAAANAICATVAGSGVSYARPEDFSRMTALAPEHKHRWHKSVYVRGVRIDFKK